MSPKKKITRLEGIPDSRMIGIIKCICYDGSRIPICTLIRELFWNEEFQYRFLPYWDVIDKIERENLAYNTNINGLDMELRKKEYIRVNMTPQFILSRVPSDSRPNLHQLLKNCNMTYYDKMLYLMRTSEYLTIDNLVLEEATDIENLALEAE